MYGSRKVGDKLWGVPAGKEEQEFVEMKSLDICGKTTVSRGKIYQKSGKIKKIKGSIREEKQWGRHITARKECKLC